jgi:ribonuclease E
VLESSTEPCPQCGGSGHVRSVSSVALQLLRGLEEVLMKGATHNLVVRTRTDVALYVLNHKRGHLRDLENSFKVTLSVIADPTVSGQQSYVIDRGEQVHTLEAAKALLAAQAAASPSQTEEVFEDDDELLDAEAESEVETDETEGLSGETGSGEAGSEGAGDGSRRRRRRRRRGRGSEAREGGMPREENALAQEAVPPAADADIGEDDEADEDESAEQANQTRADQANGGERRPRRRGRRGGRRRRGGPEDGLAGSISDELSPIPAPEAANAVADFDGISSEPQPSVVEYASEEQPIAVQPAASPVAETELQAAEQEKAARRRSTVREKVSFAAHSPSEPAAAVYSEPEPSAQTGTPAEATPEAAESDSGPRKAGWWSRRFGGG